MKSRDLIEAARSMTEMNPRRPTQASLRRAVSTAYYAMFHCLAYATANVLVGRDRSPAWHRMYRALEHGRARNACENKRALEGFPPEVRGFADTFAMLQRARQRADYALDEGVYRKSDVLGDIASAETAISRFEQADVRHRREFATQMLFRQRQP